MNVLRHMELNQSYVVSVKQYRSHQGIIWWCDRKVDQLVKMQKCKNSYDMRYTRMTEMTAKCTVGFFYFNSRENFAQPTQFSQIKQIISQSYVKH